MTNHDKPSLEALAHHGVKGMKWGIRKNEAPTPSIAKPKATFGRDGSIRVEKGADLQRLVRSNGKSLPMKDLTYASLNEYDNARYIKVIGGKGFLGGGRDQILSIKATKPIVAPGRDEATRIVSDMMLKDSAFRRKNTSPLGYPISDKELQQIRENPVGKTAQAWYSHTNVKLTFDAEFDPDVPYVQKKVREAMMSKSYNALRDENDVEGGIAKAPIIIFNPQDSLKVTSVTQITDELRSANKQKLKAYRSAGKDWVESQLYV